ncbi:toxin-antitoxin system HicB family antitoxin [Bacillus manliponensis]|uniref:toxin-antitoxin system HicB family antitoxin n=1 Tax=Bacillus manliponensis TaxID=574376 RepID=UPI0035191E61
MAKKKSFPLRIDPELHAVIEKWANDEFRSVNAHIEYLLREMAKQKGKLKKRTSHSIRLVLFFFIQELSLPL